MNAKKMKRINQHADNILLQWVHSLLNDEEAATVNATNVKQYLPQQTHMFFGRRQRLAPFSRKWVIKVLKKLVAANPTLNVEEVSLDVVKSKIKTGQF